MDVMCLVETQISLKLISYTFFLSNKVLRGKDLVAILLNNTIKLIEIRQKGRVFTYAVEVLLNIIVVTYSDLADLKRQNWVQLKYSNRSTYVITVY